MVAASYAVDTLLMLALCATGALQLRVPLVYAGVATITCVTFYVILGSGWTERFRDHYIALPYLLVHSAINITTIALAPEIGILMLMVLYVIFSFASLRMNLGRMLSATVIIVLVVAALMAWLGSRISLPMETWQQSAISALWFSLILTRTSLLGLYGSQMRTLLAKRNKQLAETFAKLDLLATRDELTSALNRRAIMQLLEEERRRMQRTGQTFAVALLDIDFFKQVNDAHGHLVGDEVLRSFVRAVSSSLRAADRLGRYGGEEFLVIFIATANEEVAMKASDRIRRAVENFNWMPITPGNQVTVSAGVAICKTDENSEQLLSRADAALYAAKNAGRNCVRFG